MIPLLLSDPSAILRYLVLKNLLKLPEDHQEVQELSEFREEDPLFLGLKKQQNKNGSWSPNSVGSTAPGGNIQSTSQALVKLSYFGYDNESEFIKRAVEFIFSKQEDDGSWPLPIRGRKEVSDIYDLQPLQTAVPLEGIISVKCWDDSRVFKAFKWLLKQKLDDGAWPSGLASGTYVGVGGYRRIAHSRWGCRSNTMAVLNCLANHPKYTDSAEAKRALDLILGCETKELTYLGFNVARIIGAEESKGWFTYYPRLDAAHVLNICVKIGATTNDERIVEIINFLTVNQGKYGLWECKQHPKASKWLTYDILKSLANLDDSRDWISWEPRTPFAAYPKKQKRV